MARNSKEAWSRDIPPEPPIIKLLAYLRDDALWAKLYDQWLSCGDSEDMAWLEADIFRAFGAKRDPVRRATEEDFGIKKSASKGRR